MWINSASWLTSRTFLRPNLNLVLHCSLGLTQLQQTQQRGRPWGDTNRLNCKYPGESHTIYCNVVTVNCMRLSRILTVQAICVPSWWSLKTLVQFQRRKIQPTSDLQPTQQRRLEWNLKTFHAIAKEETTAQQSDSTKRPGVKPKGPKDFDVIPKKETTAYPESTSDSAKVRLPNILRLNRNCIISKQ